MENRIETEALEVDMGLPEHKVVPHNTRAHHETEILDQYHLGVFHLLVIIDPWTGDGLIRGFRIYNHQIRNLRVQNLNLSMIGTIRMALEFQSQRIKLKTYSNVLEKRYIH